jgi:hypothetical protein
VDLYRNTNMPKNKEAALEQLLQNEKYKKLDN